MGHDDPRRRSRARGLPRRALPRASRRCRGQSGRAEPDAAGRRPLDPRAVPRRGCRHHDDEHLHGHLDRPGRLRARGCRPRAERRRCASCARSSRRPSCRRLRRPAQRHSFAQPEGRRPIVPHPDVRGGQRRVRRADPRARRGRGRPPTPRDDLRHAEREGRDCRRARDGAGRAALDLGHDRRPLGADALGADDRGVLGLDRARGAPDRRHQLRARCPGDAAVRGRALAARALPRQCPPERWPAERVRRLRRDRRGHEHRSCGSSRRPASSTSPEAAAARHQSTPLRSPGSSKASRPGARPRGVRVRAGAVSSRSRSARTRGSC